MIKKVLLVIYSEIKRAAKETFTLQPKILWLFWSLVLSQVLLIFYCLYVGFSECTPVLKLGQACQPSKNIIYWPFDTIRTYVILFELWWILLAFLILSIVRYFTQDKSFRKRRLTS